MENNYPFRVLQFHISDCQKPANHCYPFFFQLFVAAFARRSQAYTSTEKTFSHTASSFSSLWPRVYPFWVPARGIRIALHSSSVILPKRQGLLSPPVSKELSITKAAGKSTVPAWLWQGIVLLLVVAFLYAETLARLVRHWIDDPDFSHGFFVPLFSAFVVWTNRKQLALLPVRPSWLGLLVVAGALSVLIVGLLGAELFLARTSLVFLLCGLVIHLLGWEFFRALLFPLGFLFLMIPIPAIIFNQIAFPLQLFASQMAAEILALSGVPVLREGNVIRLPVMTLEVVEACSGIRSLVSLTTLAIIYGYLLEPRIWKRVVLALAAIPIAVVANGLRIVGTGLLGEYWDPEKAQGFFHTFSGWLIFVLSLLMLFAVHGLMKFAGRKAAEAKS